MCYHALPAFRRFQPRHHRLHKFRYISIHIIYIYIYLYIKVHIDVLPCTSSLPKVPTETSSAPQVSQAASRGRARPTLPHLVATQSRPARHNTGTHWLKVPCSLINRYGWIRFAQVPGEFRLRVSSFWLKETRSRITEAHRTPLTHVGGSVWIPVGWSCHTNPSTNSAFVGWPTKQKKYR